jgi:hypothetical protein
LRIKESGAKTLSILEFRLKPNAVIILLRQFKKEVLHEGFSKERLVGVDDTLNFFDKAHVGEIVKLGILRAQKTVFVHLKLEDMR